jgi:hypothetical protein
MIQFYKDTQVFIGMTLRDQKKYKNQIVQLLKSRGQYSKAVDDILVDSLVFNFRLIQDAQEDISKRGQMVNLRKSEDDPFYQINFSISIFHNAVKSINSILKQLGIEKQIEAPDSKADALKMMNEILK